LFENGRLAGSEQTRKTDVVSACLLVVAELTLKTASNKIPTSRKAGKRAVFMGK
jgi:hypothetical protein